MVDDLASCQQVVGSLFFGLRQNNLRPTRPLGLGLVALLLPVIGAASGGMLQLPPVGMGTWITGLLMMIGIGVLVGVLPALRAMRLNIVDALAGR